MKVKRIRNVVAGALAAASMCVTAGFAAQPAQASQCARSGCDLFASGPGSGYFFSTPGYSGVGMICWRDSGWYAGTNRWFFVSTIYGTGRAWVSANQVINQAVVGHC